MALNIPPSPTTLTAISKTGFGDPVRDSLLWLATDAPTCRVYNSANISVGTGAYAALTFDSESFDVGGCHSTSVNTGRITVPSGAGGKWSVSGNITFAVNSTGQRGVAIRLNGTTYIATATTAAFASIDASLHISAHWSASAGDYFELMAFQNSGGALNVVRSSDFSPVFSAHWLRT